jgi:hypothetical protein
MVNVGDTDRVAGDVATVWTKPSDHVTVHGVAPVRAAEIVVLCPAQMIADPETTAVGSGITFSVAVAVPPVPPSVEVTFPVTFVFTPEVVASTATLTEHEAPGAARTPPVRETEVAPATGANTPPQVFVDPGAPATCTPAGKVSVTPIPVRPIGLAAGFVIVIVRVVTWFRRTCAGENAFAIVGGVATE